MGLDAIHFHDCRLLRVVEVCGTNDLLFEVSYPVDWRNNRYEPRTIAFRDVLHYRVDEGPFAGEPTILGVSGGELAGGRRRLDIQTNAGVRTLRCADVELLEPGGAAVPT